MQAYTTTGSTHRHTPYHTTPETPNTAAPATATASHPATAPAPATQPAPAPGVLLIKPFSLLRKPSPSHSQATGTGTRNPDFGTQLYRSKVRTPPRKRCLGKKTKIPNTQKLWNLEPCSCDVGEHLCCVALFPLSCSTFQTLHTRSAGYQTSAEKSETRILVGGQN